MVRKSRKAKQSEHEYDHDDDFIDDGDQENGNADEDEGEMGEELIDEEPPNSIEPYKVLELEKDATEDQIKAAYRKAALRYHPGKRMDRLALGPSPLLMEEAPSAPDDIVMAVRESMYRFFIAGTLSSFKPTDKVSASEKDLANTKFQEVAFAYAILSDPRRRSRYDTTGRTSESFDDDDDFNWTDFFRAQYQDVITGDSIAKFKAKYQGSEEEKLDVIAAYVDFEGDMDKLFNTVMLSNPLDDEERYRKWIDEEIAAGRIEGYDAYLNEPKKRRTGRLERARRDGREAKEHAKRLGIYDKVFGNEDGVAGKKKESDISSLAALIQQRQKARAGNFLADLEAKYGGNQKTAKKKRKNEVLEEPEPPEELFQRNRSIVTKNKSSRKRRADEAIEELEEPSEDLSHANEEQNKERKTAVSAETNRDGGRKIKRMKKIKV